MGLTARPKTRGATLRERTWLEFFRFVRKIKLQGSVSGSYNFDSIFKVSSVLMIRRKIFRREIRR
ncbi:hypothetical protein LEP1GSC090_1812 [Leptospira borgpetersenii serovar Javanica str. MK146]|nr:hypothetical protein LEP1GSC090_1812 [Leptospira borgpetersenii serovar Javanica str. MK146]